MDISLPAILIVALFGHVYQVPAGYLGNCLSLRDSIKEIQLVTFAECYPTKGDDKS